MAVMLSMFALLVAGFLMWRDPTPRPAQSGFPLRILATYWLAWGALGLIWTVNEYQTQMWFLYASLAVLVFALVSRLTKPEKGWLISSYLWIAAAASVFGYFLFLTGEYERFTTSYYWANPAAAYLFPAAMIAVWRFLTTRSWISALQTLMILPAFWLTDSRGMILAATLVLILAIITSSTLRQKWLGVVGIIVLTFLLGIGITFIRIQYFEQSGITPGSRFSEAAQGESQSGKDRINYLESSFEIWKDNPIQGSGPGTFGTVHPQYQKDVKSAANDPHNYLAQTLAEQGMIGLLILIYLALVFYFGILRGPRSTPENGAIALAALALGIHFCLDIDSRYPSLIALLATLGGVVYRPWKIRLFAPRHSWILGALIIIGVLLSASNYVSNVAAEDGEIHNENRRIDLATTSFERARNQLVYNPDVWTQEGIDYYTMAAITGGSKQTYEPLARDRAKEAIKRDPNDSQHYFLMGRIERLAGRQDEAIYSYKKALELDPLNHPEYYVDLAVVYNQKGDSPAAERTIKEGLKLYPDAVIKNRSADRDIKPAIANLLVLQAKTKLDRGENESARSDLRRAKKLDPKNRDIETLRAPAGL